MNRDQVLAELRHHRQEIEQRFAITHLEHRREIWLSRLSMQC